MKAQLPIEGFGSQVLEIRSPGLLQGPILTIDGQRAPKGKRRNTYLIQRDDGRTATIRLKPSLVYDLPGVEIDGTRFEVVPRLRWFEYLLASFPLVLILVGILGIVLAAILIVACIRLFRSSLEPLPKYLAAGFLSLGVPALYYLVSFLLPQQ